MNVLVLRHETFEHLGYFGDALESHKIPFLYRDLGDHAAAPSDLNQYDALIVMGGPQSANDDLPGLAAELKLIQQAVAEGKPVLGICLGAQLIAKALGARVYKSAEKEIGWFPVKFTDDAKNDPVFAGIANPATFFHWHGETFDLPKDAVWLASSSKCPHQAFRWGANVYAIQFHPEITPEMIEDWTAQPVNCADLSAGDGEEIPSPIDPYAHDTASLARRVFDGWLTVSGLLPETIDRN